VLTGRTPCTKLHNVLTFRGLRVLLTAACLFFHLSVVAGTAITAFVFDGSSDIVCTCADGGDHGSCPMHHNTTDSGQCHLQAARHDLGLALMAALGPLTLVAQATLGHIDVPSLGLTAYMLSLPCDWSTPPDPPPPRS
jgi:hypothetical protein